MATLAEENTYAVVNPDVTINPDNTYYALLPKNLCLIELDNIPDQASIPYNRFTELAYKMLKSQIPNYIHFIIYADRCKMNTNISDITIIIIPHILIKTIVKNGITKCQFGINNDETITNIPIVEGRPNNSYIYHLSTSHIAETPKIQLHKHKPTPTPTPHPTISPHTNINHQHSEPNAD